MYAESSTVLARQSLILVDSFLGIVMNKDLLKPSI
jgi:hypothetical protein